MYFIVTDTQKLPYRNGTSKNQKVFTKVFELAGKSLPDFSIEMPSFTCLHDEPKIIIRIAIMAISFTYFGEKIKTFQNVIYTYKCK